MKNEIQKACSECNDSRLVDILQGTTPILLSANMALLSEIPMAKINSSEEYKKAWERSCDIFEISTQSMFRERSHIDELIGCVKEMIEREKGKILFAKPINSIIAAGNKILEEVEKELKDCDSKIVVYSTPDEEIEERQENLQKAIKRMNRKISGLEDTLDEEFGNIVRKARNEMEDIVDETVKKLNRIVDNWGAFQDYEKISPQISNEIDKLQTRSLKRCMEEQQDSAQRKLRSVLEDFFEEADEIIWKYLPDFDQKGFLNEVKKEIKLSIDEDLFKMDPSTEEEQSFSFGDLVDSFLNGYTLGLWNKVTNLMGHDEQVSKLKELFNELSTQFDATEYTQSILQSNKTIIEKVQTKYQTEFLLPIQEEFDGLVANQSLKEKTLTEVKKKKEELLVSKEKIKEQLDEMNSSLQEAVMIM